MITGTPVPLLYHHALQTPNPIFHLGSQKGQDISWQSHPAPAWGPSFEDGPAYFLPLQSRKLLHTSSAYNPLPELMSLISGHGRLFTI